MKKTLLLLAVGLVAGFVTVGYACEHDEKGMMGGMDGKDGMMKGSMHGMMKGMGTSMVATSDGGVVVLKGGTLTKYDKNLNVVKTADVSDGAMVGKGKKGKGCCMMGMDKKKTDQAEDAAAPAAPEDTEHTEHHPEK